MAKVDYEFEPDGAEKSRAGIYVRLAAIFLLVAGLTAGVIWFVIPKSEEAKKEAPVPPKTETPVPPEETGGAVSRPRPSGSGKKPAGESALPIAPPAETEAPATENSAPAETPKPVVEPLAPEVTPTLEPEKGKPWVGDPVIDRPDVPAANIPVDVRPSLDADLNRAEQAVGEKNYRAAAAAAEKTLSAAAVTPYSAEWRQAAALLNKANLGAFAARAAVEGETQWHVAKPGDSFSRVAAKYQTTVESIKHYNRIPEGENNLRVSQRLLVHPGPWKIMVRKGPRVLELFNGNRLYAVFDIGIGRLDKTPAASFVVSSKLRNPDWYTPGGGVVRYGDPENPLGTRFLKLAPTGAPDRPLLGYGIHGTRDDSDITRSLSNGCIRMRNADVETLYTIVPGRTPVEIVE